MEKGMTHLYFGDGKGKTTAAVGLSVRAAGSGLHVVFAQLMKNDKSGERAVLATIPGITLLPSPPCEKFHLQMTQPERAAYADAALAFFYHAFAVAINADMLVLDELGTAVEYGLITPQTVFSALEAKPFSLEVVLTGGRKCDLLAHACDYVSEIRCIRHPYQTGIAARKGIEF